MPLKEVGTIGANGRDSTGFSWSKTIANEKGFSRIDVVARTNSGSIQTSFSSPENIKDFKVDFAPWFASLRDSRDFSVTRTEQFNSLADYVIEENFRQRIKKQEFNQEMREPKIWITNGSAINSLSSFFELQKSLYVTLVTRYGDGILLRPIHADDEGWWTVQDETEFNLKANQLANLLKEYYNLEITKSYRIPTKLQLTPVSWNGIEIPPKKRRYRIVQYIEIPFYGMDEMKMTRCYHKGYDMEFLLYDGGKGRRYAFALYDKVFIGTYGLEKIYQNAPLVDFPEEYVIDDYVVVGL